jgi:hypothetical protein
MQIKAKNSACYNLQPASALVCWLADFGAFLYPTREITYDPEQDVAL